MGLFDFWRPKQAALPAPSEPEEPTEAEFEAIAKSFATQLFLVNFGGKSSEGFDGYSDALSAYRNNSVAYLVSERLASLVAQVEWVALKPKGASGGLSPSKWAQRQKGFYTRDADDLVTSGEYELLQRSDMLDVWNAGNPELSAHDIRRVLVLNYLLAGGCYLYIKRSAAQRPAELWPFSIPLTTPHRGKDGRISSYDLKDGHISFEKVRPRNVWRWRSVDPAKPYSSVAGFGTAVATELSIDEHAGQIASRRFTNDGTPPGMFTVEGASDEQLAALKRRFGQRSNLADVGRAIWSNKQIAYEVIGEKLVDMGLTDLRDSMRDRARQASGMAPETVGDNKDSNRATSREADRQTARQAVRPQLTALARFLNDHLPRAMGLEGQEVLSFVNPEPSDEHAKDTLLERVPDIIPVGQALAHGSFELYEDEEINEMSIGEYKAMIAASHAPEGDPSSLEPTNEPDEPDEDTSDDEGDED